MLPSFCKEEITRLRAPFKTERGSKVRDWESDEVDQLVISRCSVQNASMVRQFTRAENVESGDHLFAPVGADIQLGDRIVHNGKTYEIDGEPAVWTPLPHVAHTWAKLKRWKG